MPPPEPPVLVRQSARNTLRFTMALASTAADSRVTTAQEKAWEADEAAVHHRIMHHRDTLYEKTRLCGMRKRAVSAPFRTRPKTHKHASPHLRLWVQHRCVGNGERGATNIPHHTGAVTSEGHDRGLLPGDRLARVQSPASRIRPHRQPTCGEPAGVQIQHHIAGLWYALRDHHCDVERCQGRGRARGGEHDIDNNENTPEYELQGPSVDPCMHAQSKSRDIGIQM